MLNASNEHFGGADGYSREAQVNSSFGQGLLVAPGSQQAHAARVPGNYHFDPPSSTSAGSDCRELLELRSIELSRQIIQQIWQLALQERERQFELRSIDLGRQIIQLSCQLSVLRYAASSESVHMQHDNDQVVSFYVDGSNGTDSSLSSLSGRSTSFSSLSEFE